MAVDELFRYAAEGVIMALFDFLVMAVIVWGIVRIIPRWLRTQEGITQRRMQALEQRIRHSERELSRSIMANDCASSCSGIFYHPALTLRMMSPNV
jgi:hypothetical protein